MFHDSSCDHWGCVCSLRENKRKKRAEEWSDGVLNLGREIWWELPASHPFSHIYFFMLSLSYSNSVHNRKSLIYPPLAKMELINDLWAHKIFLPERHRGKEVWSRGGKDEDEILLWFVKEVCCATGFKVGGKEICVVGDGGQNNDLAMMIVRYQQNIRRENGWWSEQGIWGMVIGFGAQKCILVGSFCLSYNNAQVQWNAFPESIKTKLQDRIQGKKVFLSLFRNYDTRNMQCAQVFPAQYRTEIAHSLAWCNGTLHK